MSATIAGWIATDPSRRCEQCSKPANVIVEFDGVSSRELCNDCAPKDIPDPVADVFAAAFANLGKEQAV